MVNGRGRGREPPQSRPSKDAKSLAVPIPSASILLISPQNTILLLHRVDSSTSFASAHVFPGGHIAPQDGYLPPVGDFRRHEDSTAYRMGAIRECFEESGILLAKSRETPNELLALSDEEREHGRHAIHKEEVNFSDWLESKGAVPDVDGLHAFTRWLTPITVSRRRFSTQMYLYFLPLTSSSNIPQEIQTPTSDGGIEHTTAEFLPVSEWLARSTANQITLFPPQIFLLSIIAPFLSQIPEAKDTAALQAQRDRLFDFLKHQEDGEPTWADKCISSTPVWKVGNRVYMSLEPAGPEVEGTGRKGDGRRMVSWIFRDGRPQDLEVSWTADIMREKERLGGDGSHSLSRDQGESEKEQSGRQGKEKL